MTFYINVIELSTITPLFGKEGLGEIFQNVNKIPLHPPLSKGELKENTS